MNSQSHRMTTTLVFDLFDKLEGYDLSFADDRKKIIKMAVNVDKQKDMEMVKVQGMVRFRWNDPKNRPKFMPKIMHDTPSYSWDVKKDWPFLHWTALNHYMDIGKGRGTYDDYDGYSFYNGSASKIGKDKKMGADGGAAVYLDIRYLHAPGHPFYDNCSPAVERYSRWFENDKYSNLEEESHDRFPLSPGRPALNAGYPYSVFIPIDNITRYWYEQYVKTREPECVGWVCHTIQDCSVPQHATAVIGHHHFAYEKRLDQLWEEVQEDQDFLDHVIELFHSFEGHDDDPPTSLDKEDHVKTPCMNWRIDMLATWMALNSHKEFNAHYRDLGKEFEPDLESMRELLSKAVAMSMLVALKADKSTQEDA
jgi:hypothetical protein